MRFRASIAGLMAGMLLLAGFLLMPATAQEAGGGKWISLFNGKDLAGWDEPLADKDNGSEWQVLDGVLEGRGGGGPNWGSLVSQAKFTNYRLFVKFRYADPGGGGIELRRTGEADVTSCYWVSTSVTNSKYARNRSPGNILKIKSYKYNSAAPPIRKSAQIDARSGTWHSLEIVVSNNRITTFCDGQKSDDYTDPRKSYASGNIAVTCFGDSRVEFAQIDIQPLPE